MTPVDRLLSAVARNAGRLKGGTVGCLFTFHRAARHGDWASLPDRDFYVDIDFLDELLTYLGDHAWSIVTIDEALKRAAAGDRSRFVNFSIDDCYRDTYELVVPLFRKHRAPVTLFVTTGIPDGTLVMWQSGLEQALQQRSSVQLEGRTVDTSAYELKRALYRSIFGSWDGPHAARQYAAFCVENGLDADSIRARHAITWEMLNELVTDAFVEIGSHTISHPRVSSLAEGDAFDELAQSRNRLEEKLNAAVHHFAFPYGRSGDCGERDFRLVQQAGYQSASTTRKGNVRAHQDPFRLPRNTLNGKHQRMLQAELHLAGFSGLAARMLNRV